MQIASWNINSLKVRLPQVLEWLQLTNCDILALQELKLANEFFPSSAFQELGYNCIFNGQKTYNGVAIVSKYPIEDITYDIPGYDDVQKRVISATISGIRIICVYVVNGESVDSNKYIYKLAWLEQLYNFVKINLSLYNKLVLLGDFNIAPADNDVYDPSKWQEQVLCSTLEREKWQQFLSLGLHDSFRLSKQENGQYSWWDYRNFAFKRKQGLRIDHILINDLLKSQMIACNIDIAPRKNERPSDHAPIVLHI
jgi:exodeoxyribonuclease-3